MPNPAAPNPAEPPEPAAVASTAIAPTTIAEDLARLVRLGRAMRAETRRIEAEHAAFWRACRARARARADRAAAP